MQMLAGRTRCPLCGEILWETDDVIALRSWGGTSELRGFQSAVHHYECFLRSPFRDAYLAIARAAEIERLRIDETDGFLEILAENGTFALVRRRKRLELLTLGHGRVFRFAEAAAIQTVASLLGPSEADDQQRVDSETGFSVSRGRDVTLRQDRTAMCSYIVHHSEAEAAMTWAGRALNDDPGGFVDLEAAFRAQGIRPRTGSCPVERAKGEWIDSTLDPRSGNVELRIGVPAVTTVIISSAEAEGLREMLTAAELF